MFEIKYGENGEIVLLGRFDASRIEQAAVFFDAVTKPSVVDLRDLEYISSMGLGLLLRTQKRLVDSAERGLRLVNIRPHIRDVFHYSGFHIVFELE